MATTDFWEEKFDKFAENQLISFKYGADIKEETYLNEIWATAYRNIKGFLRETRQAAYEQGLRDASKIVKYLPFNSAAQEHKPAYVQGYADARKDFLKALREIRLQDKKGEI